MTRDEFETRLTMILQDVALGTTADLTDRAVAYWDGQRLVYAYLCSDDSGHIDAEFDLTPHWAEWRDWLAEWMDEPTFSVRPELQEGIRGAPRGGAPAR